jgi:hypothetical protein
LLNGAQLAFRRTGVAVLRFEEQLRNGSCNTPPFDSDGHVTPGSNRFRSWLRYERLTVTAGLRYENQRPATERYNRLAYFNENVVNPISAQAAPLLGRQIHGGFEYADANNRFAWPPENLNFAPRLGVAFKITDKLVARAGAGIFYAPASAMISFDSPGQFPGFNSTTNYTGTEGGQGYIPQGLVSNPFPNGITQPVGNSRGLNTYVGLGAGQVWPKAPHPTGYSEQWSFDLAVSAR